MFAGKFRTPLYAAFFYAAILAGCKADIPATEVTVTQCPGRTTPIASVQGDDPRSPMIGQQVTLQGIVTLIQSDRGLYIEEPGSDANQRTSNAVFIQSTELPNEVRQGSLISARGTVSEIGKGRYPLTALSDLSELTQCSTNHALPLTDVELPLHGIEREALEGMRIQINEPLTITDVYQFNRGNFTLSGNGFQFIPTEVMAPGPDAAGFHQGPDRQGDRSVEDGVRRHIDAPRARTRGVAPRRG